MVLKKFETFFINDETSSILHINTFLRTSSLCITFVLIVCRRRFQKLYPVALRSPYIHTFQEEDSLHFCTNKLNIMIIHLYSSLFNDSVRRRT